jgi:hypothetical protein
MTLITLQPDGATGVDTQLDSANVATNYATATDFSVGERDDVGTQIYRSLIKFDLSVIPVHARIFRADLTLMISADRSSSSGNFRIFRVLRDWVETEATWQNWSSGNAWTGVGCSGEGTDFNISIWASLAFGNAESGAKTWSLDLALFSKMVRREFPNYGWLIESDTQNNDAYQFRSSDYGVAADRPKLEIEYISGVSPTISPFVKF